MTSSFPKSLVGNSIRIKEKQFPSMSHTVQQADSVVHQKPEVGVSMLSAMRISTDQGIVPYSLRSHGSLLRKEPWEPGVRKTCRKTIYLLPHHVTLERKFKTYDGLNDLIKEPFAIIAFPRSVFSFFPPMARNSYFSFDLFRWSLSTAVIYSVVMVTVCDRPWLNHTVSAVTQPHLTVKYLQCEVKMSSTVPRLCTNLTLSTKGRTTALDFFQNK